jgi:hypothetical protein
MMNEANELVEFDKIASGIKEIQEQGNFIPDVSTKEGYEASKRFVLDVTTPTRTKLDKAHKTAKAYWVSGGKNVDAKKNEILSILVDIQQPHQEAYKAFDQDKKDKKAKFEADLQEKINKIYHYRTLPPLANSEDISSIIQQCGETDTQEGFYHLEKEAASTRAESLQILNELLMAAVSYEAQQQRDAELAEENRLRQIEIDAQQEVMRLQQEKMDAQQAEFDRVENEAKARAQFEAEEKQRLIDEAERAEKERNAAIEREEYAKKQAEIAAEIARQDEQARQKKAIDDQKIIDEKRASNNRHVTKIKKQAKESFIDAGLSEEDAINAVQALSKGLIKNCTINY